ncbi:hypothetical protein IVB69_01155 [Flavobacterium sp. J49]|uniref:hypothetical protein n=1 Tax=Flavobacterium sp. J49 TaxID=2718534 RepID=UPI001593B777|nr:hypothetical protein [Flavobacterium sp. J49]MBF6640076.1 hypothetical protein [Flavobacterium sp. J49]NIC01321.1 hypothetical protein [Flavobacterium sp. J49]
MKRILFSNWHLMRIFRMAFALFLFYQAYATRHWFFVAFGVFFLFQAVFNMGCGPNSCTVNYKNQKNE